MTKDIHCITHKEKLQMNSRQRLCCGCQGGWGGVVAREKALQPARGNAAQGTKLTEGRGSGGNNLALEGGVLLQVFAVFAVDGAGHNGAQHMVHLPDSCVCRALEEHQALLQQAAVPHLRGNQVRLIAISLLYNPLHIGWLQNLHTDRVQVEESRYMLNLRCACISCMCKQQAYADMRS